MWDWLDADSIVTGATWGAVLIVALLVVVAGAISIVRGRRKGRHGPDNDE